MRKHSSRHLICPLSIATLALLLALPAQAAVIQVAITGLTENTSVASGDPCATGLSGDGACDGQLMVFDVLVDLAAAPADTNSATNVGNYWMPVVPGFMTATATINDQSFILPVHVGVNQSIDLYDNLDTAFGVLDRIQFSFVGGDFATSFSAQPNVVLQGGSFSGDALSLLGTIADSPLVFSGPLSLSFGSFAFAGATGEVTGLIRISEVSLAPVPAPPALLLFGTALASMAGYRWRKKRL